MRMFDSTYIDNGRTLARITISPTGDALKPESRKARKPESRRKLEGDSACDRTRQDPHQFVLLSIHPVCFALLATVPERKDLNNFPFQKGTSA